MNQLNKKVIGPLADELYNFIAKRKPNFVLVGRWGIVEAHESKYSTNAVAFLLDGQLHGANESEVVLKSIYVFPKHRVEDERFADDKWFIATVDFSNPNWMEAALEIATTAIAFIETYQPPRDDSYSLVWWCGSYNIRIIATGTAEEMAGYIRNARESEIRHYRLVSKSELKDLRETHQVVEIGS